jgi:hypothetical protein
MGLIGNRRKQISCGHARQPEVQQHAIEMLLCQPAQQVPAIAEYLDLDISLSGFQGSGDESLVAGIIFDYEDPCFHDRSCSSAVPAGDMVNKLAVPVSSSLIGFLQRQLMVRAAGVYLDLLSYI